MFKILTKLFIVLPVLVCLSCNSEDHTKEHQKSVAFLTDMADVMDNMRDYTLAVYDVPEDSNMTFRPTALEMTFQEQTAHMLSNMYLQFECFVKRDTTTDLNWAIEDAAEIMAIEDRAVLREKLKMQFDEISGYLRTMDAHDDWNKERVLPQFDGQPKKDLMTILMMMRDHITHHRGQMVVYLRLMGHEPPQYKPF
jgi:uncharacterized damage-inducible protein DinB